MLEWSFFQLKVGYLDKLRGWLLSVNFAGILSRKKCSGYLLPSHHQIQFLHFLPSFFTLNLFFSEKNGLTVCQYVLLSAIFFHLSLQSITFFLCWEEIHKGLFCLVQGNFSNNIFCNSFTPWQTLHCVKNVQTQSYFWSVVMKGLLFSRMYYFSSSMMIMIMF